MCVINCKINTILLVPVSFPFELDHGSVFFNTWPPIGGEVPKWVYRRMSLGYSAHPSMDKERAERMFTAGYVQDTGQIRLQR